MTTLLELIEAQLPSFFSKNVQGILALCEFHYCEFHYCGFSKNPLNLPYVNLCLMLISLVRLFWLLLPNFANANFG